MSVTYLEPRAEPGLPVDPYTARLAEAARSGGVTIGLLANGFPDSVAFLDHVEKALADAAPPGTAFRRYDKGNASATASGQMVDAITKECDAVVTAYGH